MFSRLNSGCKRGSCKKHSPTYIYERLEWMMESCNVVLPFESLDEILQCGHSSESYWAVLSCGTVYYAVQGGSTFWVWMKSLSVTIRTKATEQYFPVVLFVVLYKVVLTFAYLDEIPLCDHSNETSLSALSRGAICFSAFYKMKFGIVSNFDFAISRKYRVKYMATKGTQIRFRIKQTPSLPSRERLIEKI